LHSEAYYGDETDMVKLLTHRATEILLDESTPYRQPIPVDLQRLQLTVEQHDELVNEAIAIYHNWLAQLELSAQLTADEQRSVLLAYIATLNSMNLTPELVLMQYE
jgi:hypothetical protein